MTYSVFTYGTLQVPEVMEAVTGKIFEHATAVLVDYQRFCIRKQVYPGIVPKRGRTVEGRAYFNLNKSDLELLDAFEDDLYERKIAEVVCDNKKIEVQLYVVNEKFISLLSDDPWDITRFTNDHMATYLVSCRKFHEFHKTNL